MALLPNGVLPHPLHCTKIATFASTARHQSVLCSFASVDDEQCKMQHAKASTIQIEHVVVEKENQQQQQQHIPSSAMAVACAIQTASSIHVDCTMRFRENSTAGFVVEPSMEFIALCSEQLRACDQKLQQLIFTMYVRTAECYGSGELELRHLPLNVHSPSSHLLLLFKTDITALLHKVEMFVAERGPVELPKYGALIVPMVKEFCLVGVLAAERELSVAQYNSEIIVEEAPFYSSEEISQITRLATTLALACVMDQRVGLLHKSSWQKSVQIESLLEQARGSLTTMRTLGKMVLPQLKRGEIVRDVMSDMLVQGDRMKEVIQLMQQVMYLSQSSPSSSTIEEESTSAEDNGQDAAMFVGVDNEDDATSAGDEEVPMPPFTLAASSCGGWSCDASKVVMELMRGVKGIAKRKGIEMSVVMRCKKKRVDVEESALREALSKLMENAVQRTPTGGWVRIRVVQAPGGGGVLIVIEDNGPDMSFLMQAEALGPLGSGLKGLRWEEGNERAAALRLGMEMKLARDRLEEYGVVMRMISPYLIRASAGAGGVHIEFWLPSNIN